MNVIDSATDITGFHQFVGEHLDRLNGYVGKLTSRDAEVTKDIVQTTIIKTFRHLQSGKAQVEDLKVNWLFEVAKNEYFQYLRSQKKHLKTLSLDGPGVPEASYDGISAIEATVLRQALLDAMDRLTDDHREIVQLIDLEGTDYKVAALKLGLPLGTVRSRLSRARLRLATMLRDHVEGADDLETLR